MKWDPLRWVLEHLQENGASAGDLLLAKQRGGEIIQTIGDADMPERLILDTLKAEFGITTDVLDSDQINLEKNTKKYLLEGTLNPIIRGQIFRGWGRKNKEGD